MQKLEFKVKKIKKKSYIKKLNYMKFENGR